jgi:hypothetical protein
MLKVFRNPLTCKGVKNAYSVLSRQNPLVLGCRSAQPQATLKMRFQRGFRVLQEMPPWRVSGARWCWRRGTDMLRQNMDGATVVAPCFPAGVVVARHPVAGGHEVTESRSHEFGITGWLRVTNPRYWHAARTCSARNGRSYGLRLHCFLRPLELDAALSCQ